ncbi:hypothetical protein GCM10009601_05990 [Streptomyces thermospinosisporus]|uniref:Uncharacterized protein n=1 Tax=Streptomyces thermospinosisporus TaxID=161482 RepID=A0ABN1YJI6_9ACTN
MVMRSVKQTFAADRTCVSECWTCVDTRGGPREPRNRPGDQRERGRPEVEGPGHGPAAAAPRVVKTTAAGAGDKHGFRT